MVLIYFVTLLISKTLDSYVDEIKNDPHLSANPGTTYQYNCTVIVMGLRHVLFAWSFRLLHFVCYLEYSLYYAALGMTRTYIYKRSFWNPLLFSLV
jgi:hypothetical protein